jgi:hypothetical protein
MPCCKPLFRRRAVDDVGNLEWLDGLLLEDRIQAAGTRSHKPKERPLIKGLAKYVVEYKQGTHARVNDLGLVLGVELRPCPKLEFVA